MVNAEPTKVNSDKCRTYKSPFGQMQNLTKSIRTNAELTKVHSEKCLTYKSPFGQMQNLQKYIRTNAERTKISKKFGQMENVQKLVRNSDKCIRPIQTTFKMSGNFSIYLQSSFNETDHT